MDSRNHCALFGCKSTVNTYIQKKIRIIFRCQFPQKNSETTHFLAETQEFLYDIFFSPCIIHVDFFVLPLIPFSFFHYKHGELKISANNKWNCISNSIPVFHEFFFWSPMGKTREIFTKFLHNFAHFYLTVMQGR